MKRFVEGEDRRQAYLLPEFAGRLRGRGQPGPGGRGVHRRAGSGRAWVRGRAAGGDGATGLSPGDDVEALPLRLPQPPAVQPPARARSRAQHRADVADRAAGAGLQDHRQLPPRQRSGDPRGVRAVRGPVPPDEPLHQGDRRDRRQQVQGGEQPRQELHRGQGRQAPAAGRRQHRSLPGRAGPGRPRRRATSPRPRPPASRTRSPVCAGRCRP